MIFAQTRWLCKTFVLDLCNHSISIMAPSASKATAKVAKKEVKKATKEKVFHPQSRKAGQLERAQLRKHKLANASNKRGKNLVSKGESPGANEWLQTLI